MTERKYTNRKCLDALEQKVLVFDGAMGTSLQIQNLTAEHFGGEQYNGCNDYLVISYPEAVEKIHRSFLEVGVDVLETNTFRSNRITMQEYGLQDRVKVVRMGVPDRIVTHGDAKLLLGKYGLDAEGIHQRVKQAAADLGPSQTKKPLRAVK